MKPVPLRIDIVSDVVCPWCILGYLRLRKALSFFPGKLQLDLHWHPFELNPNMPEGGQKLRQHFAQKYGMTREQSAALSQQLTEYGASLGFSFNNYQEMSIYNTFKAHQLLHWAKEQGEQTGLQMKFFTAYFTEQKAVDESDVLLDAVQQMRLDSSQARGALTSGVYADTVKRLEAEWIDRGIYAVPAFIFDNKYLISGAQEPEIFEAQITKHIAG